jgi:hypothetical protein
MATVETVVSPIASVMPTTNPPYQADVRPPERAKSPLIGRFEHLLTHSRLPLRISTALGGLVLAVGLFLALWFPIQGWLWPGTVWFSWCYLIVLLHFLGGSILCSIGLVGECLGQILEQTKQPPVYILQDRLTVQKETT